MKRFATMATKHFDVCVIGGGAGMKIYNEASERSLKVALCEMERFGGTCLNRGCIPSKCLIHPADLVTQIQEDAAKLSITVPGSVSVDFPGLVDRVARLIDADADSIAPDVLADENVTWFRNPVKFVGERVLSDGETTFSADKVFIAAGARASIPDVPGLAGTPFMTYREALRNKALPKKLLVVGAGYIAMELAHWMGSMGSDVTVIARSEHVLRASDQECVREFLRVFSKRYDVRLNCGEWKSCAFDEATHEFTLKFAHGLEIKGDGLLVATGVVPNSDLLDLKASGIATRHGGFVKVDDRLQTTCKNVWAFGDVAGNFLFRHSANFESDYLNDVVFERGGDPASAEPIDYTGMPHAVFSYPQVAGVGETEEELVKRGANYVSGVNPYAKSAMGMALISDHGFTKILVDADSRRILGFHAVGHEASTLVHNVIPLFRLGGKLEDLLYCVYIHPALNELVRNAARRARNALVQKGHKIPYLLSIK
eukprot:ANDGO_03009.mRNA.1 Mycothione reductase